MNVKELINLLSTFPQDAVVSITDYHILSDDGELNIAIDRPISALTHNSEHGKVRFVVTSSNEKLARQMEDSFRKVD